MRRAHCRVNKVPDGNQSVRLVRETYVQNLRTLPVQFVQFLRWCSKGNTAAPVGLLPILLLLLLPLMLSGPRLSHTGTIKLTRKLECHKVWMAHGRVRSSGYQSIRV